jgi:hypothetical protein
MASSVYQHSLSNAIPLTDDCCYWNGFDTTSSLFPDNFLFTGVQYAPAATSTTTSEDSLDESQLDNVRLSHVTPLILKGKAS